MIRAALRMAPLIRKRRNRPGAPPGSVQVDPNAEPSTMQVIGYGPDGYQEQREATVNTIRSMQGEWPVVWVNIDGLGTDALIHHVAQHFEIHPLALEDVVNVHQRPKVNVWPAHHYIVLRMVREERRGDTEQVSLFIGENWVVTFQEAGGDSFDPVRERIRRGSGRIRGVGADYLGYSLVDALVDRFFPLLEGYAEELEHLEADVVRRPTSKMVSEIHALKRELLGLRRMIWPVRDAIASMLREHRVSQDLEPYWRDCHDHSMQLVEIVEACRELAQSALESYNSYSGQRLNEVMKVLTMIATVFIPLSFIAGVYGMNFDDIPGLHSNWGFVACMVLMVGVAVAMFFVFMRKGWIGDDGAGDDDDDR